MRCDASATIHEANHIQAATAASVAEVEAVFAFQEEVFADRAYRHFLTDPTTPPAVTAGLALRGYSPTPNLQLLLEGDLQGTSPRPADIRPVISEDEWSRLYRLIRANHLEKDAKSGRAVFSERVSAEMFEAKRSKGPALRYFLAWESDEAVACFSAWPGTDGLGMVEDLFTLPTWRRTGLARALIHRCVADARDRGASAVLIGADPDDTPKHAYVAMGFRPVCLTWEWNRRVDG